MIHYSRMESPIGKLLLVAQGNALTSIEFDDAHASIEDDWQERADHPVLRKAKTQLEEYFAGKRKTFNIALAARGTAFQCRVWKALERIPYGKTQSYGEIARKINSPKAVRAVGAANGANPIPIVVPCHRVIGADGSLTGYGGGLWRKRELLALENDGFGPRPRA